MDHVQDVQAQLAPHDSIARLRSVKSRDVVRERGLVVVGDVVGRSGREELADLLFVIWVREPVGSGWNRVAIDF